MVMTAVPACGEVELAAFIAFLCRPSQAEVYREDFLKERSDREKLHGRYLELEKKYRKACRELRALRPQVHPHLGAL